MKDNKKADARQALTRYLEANSHRKTQERFTILDAVYDIEGHFTLEELSHRLTDDYHFTVSRATLFNTIRLFLAARLIIRHRFHGETKYEACYDREGHCHQVCTECGSVKEITSPIITSAISKMHLNRFNKDGFALYIYGICSTCRAKITRRKAHTKKLKSQKHTENE